MIDWNLYFDYESDGRLYWAVDRGKNKAGKEAGTPHNQGYRQLMLKGIRYLSHRVIWEMHYGEIPNGLQIDHIDQDKTNNRIENLRLATRSENQHNKDCLGFSWNNRDKVYQASIQVNGKQKNLGYYDNVIDARAAYLRAKRELHPTAPVHICNNHFRVKFNLHLLPYTSSNARL